MKYLESLPESEENMIRIDEVTLCIVRVQQILINELSLKQEENRHKNEMKKIQQEGADRLKDIRKSECSHLEMGRPVHPSLIPPNHREHL